jgi:D-aspartate ligase
VSHTERRDRRQPCIVMHGGVNALSIVRSLGRLGIPVYALNDADSPVLRSHYAKPIVVPRGGTQREDAWAKYLLGPDGEYLSGSLLLACGDPALRMIAQHRAAFARRFQLELGDPEVQLAMLDKHRSLEIASEAGVGHPRFWAVRDGDDLDARAEALPFPLLVKPVDTFRYAELTGHKMAVAENRSDLQRAISAVGDTGLEFVLVEIIPGPDDLLCSYYTYLNEDGEPELQFTKRVIRRYPRFEGPACYHVTDWVPDAAESGLRFLQHAGVRGLGVVEFKRDVRDGQLKFIECNPRFSAANNLVAAAGFDLGLYVYDRMTGGASPLADFRQGLHLWHPVSDFRAMLQLRQRGEITVGGWARGLAHTQVLPWFARDDLGPSLQVVRGGLGAGTRALQRSLDHRTHKS